MSTRATIFLTADTDDHVYEDVTDWSVNFEISKQNIEAIKYRGYNSKKNRVIFGEIAIEDIEYICISTRANYNFIDSFKKRAFCDDSIRFSKGKKNTLNKLYFELNELSLVETDKQVLNDPGQAISDVWDIEVTLKTDSEWFKLYKIEMERRIRIAMYHLKEMASEVMK